MQRGDIQKRSIITALIVGTILNIINQGTNILAGESPMWTKLLLTYMVPYCVSLYSAVSTTCALECDDKT